MNNIAALHSQFLNSTGISTDTRKVEKGNIFFALKGENFDGNLYAKQAIASGALLAVIDNDEFNTSDQFILVDDVLTTLQQLASYHRKYLNIPILALTGSNGKTTTKELIREVLARKFNVSATSGNFNNHIGVPLTLLKMTKETEIGVVEMGANHVGEIAALCAIANPSHGMITNIGKAHLEGFGGYEGVLRAKSELYHHIINSKGQLFANSDDEVLVNMTRRATNPVYYNNKEDYYCCELVSADPFVKLLDEEGNQVTTHLIGQYNFKNIAAALCIAKFFGVDAKSANEAISDYVPANNRSQIINTKSNMVVLDAYNANPVSMKGALDNLAAMKHPKKIAILGDMFELGKDEAFEHETLLNIAISLNLDQVLVCGHACSRAAKDKPGIDAFKDKEALKSYLKEKAITDSLVLIKASRGMGLEDLVELL